jgi:D-xylose reductase
MSRLALFPWATYNFCALTFFLSVTTRLSRKGLTWFQPCWGSMCPELDVALESIIMSPMNSDQTIPLADSASMPAVGLGTWKIPNEHASVMVCEAMRTGYRHLDCACDYGNEAEVGAGLAKALAESVCHRDEIWITSKLWNTYHDPRHVRLACERSLRDLQLDVLDLYLVHFPIALDFVPFDRRYPPGWFYDPAADHPVMKPVRISIGETWGAMEELVRAGLVRRIGVSNFGTSLLRDLLACAAIRPAVLQVELHPFLTQEKLLRFCREESIAVTAFSPLGAPSYISLGMARPEESILDIPEVCQMARRHGRTAAQVLLRWGIQRGTAVIPKTSNPARLKENLGIFDFRLNDDEMKAVSALNRNRRFNDPGDFCEQAFNTFFPIYE